MSDGRYIENRYFWPYLCSRLPDFSEILRGEAIFHINQQWDRYPRSTERIFCFPNAAWASASSGFRIASDTLIINLLYIVFCDEYNDTHL